VEFTRPTAGGIGNPLLLPARKVYRGYMEMALK